MTFALAVVLAGATHLQDIPRQIERGGMERRDERSSTSFDIVIEGLVPTASETTAKVRLKNLADFVLEEVELICAAFDERERELASRTWRLTESGSTEMKPGEAIAVTLTFAAPASKVRSATCNARGW